MKEDVVTDEGVATTTTKLYPNGLPVCITDPLGHKTTYEYTFGKELIKNTRDARGVVTREVLDPLDRLIEVKVFDRMGGCILDKSIRYDKASRPIRYEEKAVGGTNETVITEQAYAEGHVVRLTLAKGTPDEANSIYEYNRAGQKISETKSSGVNLLFKYDAKGRLSKHTSSDGSVGYRYSYDSSDRCIKAVDLLTGKSIERSYNPFSELTSERLEELTVASQYNSFGACIQRTLPDNTKVDYSYRDGMLSTIVCAGYKAEVLSRTLNGNMQELKLPNESGVITYRYDLLGRRVESSHPQYNEQCTLFDQVGNLLERKVHDSTEHFGYDDLSQLTSEPNATYRYDSLNRRVERSGVTYKHNARHQLLADDMRYDKDGRRTHHGDTRYHYDALDRLTEVITPTNRYKYGYDAFHRRLWRKVCDLAGAQISHERFLYFGNDEVGSYREGKIQELRILGEGLGAEIGAAVALELHGQVVVPLHDLSGSVVALLGDAGKSLESCTYTAFGEVDTGTKNSISPWRFASKRYDPETGLHFFGRRYYDATNGVWLTQDPLGIQEGPNLYAYVRNNPLTLLDLYGLLEERGFFERAWDTICDGASSAFDYVGSFFSGSSGGSSSVSDQSYASDPINSGNWAPSREVESIRNCGEFLRDPS
ncbi:MAG: RHS repeat domain-containing protein, partial [Candidatus Saccharimonadales bacterium]